MVLCIDIIILIIVEVMIMTKLSNEHHSITIKSTDSTYIKNKLLTLFLHIYARSMDSEKYMVQQVQYESITKDVIAAYMYLMMEKMN